MHSLKLGGLEFNPSHTVNEHRPKNFTLPDIIIEEPTNSTFDLHLLNGAANYPVQNPNRDDSVLDIDDNAVTPSLMDDMWNEDLWSNVVFKEMHDPKHRHPRHHGK